MILIQDIINIFYDLPLCGCAEKIISDIRKIDYQNTNELIEKVKEIYLENSCRVCKEELK